MWSYKRSGLLLVFLLGLFSLSVGQILEPVEWDLAVSKASENTVALSANATIEENWHVYSVVEFLDEDGIGPVPTSIVWVESIDYEIVGELSQGSEPITHFDPNFGMDLEFYESTASFEQMIKLKKDGPILIEGELNYMACDDSKCIFPAPVPIYISVNADRTEVTVSQEAPKKEQSSGIFEPAKWSFSSVDNGNGTYDVQMTCTLDEHWHVYSQNLSSDEGPLPTEFAFTLPDGVTAEGKVQEGEPHIEYDPNFMMDLAFFDGSATFTQTVKANTPVKIAGSVYFMVCDDERCLPPELIEFEVDLASGKGGLLGFDPTSGGGLEEGVIPNLPLVNLDAPKSNCGGEIIEYNNVWMVFLFGFIGGLFALLTPCVFPMIPLTVSFFTKGSESRSQGISKALLYGFFIFLIYFILSIPFHFGVEPEVLNQIATGATLNIIFFVLFVVFAISFFGFFELTLPSGMVNKVDSASNVGGLIGVFLMALTLALVSFSCTGPILGAVLGNALKNGPWPITAAMSGFGIALGLPFALFAMFPSMMKSLPKSGGWLSSVKVVLGFLELALAVKFLSNADLVYQWGLVERETFFLVWVIIFAGLGLYLLGLIRFPHDTKGAKISPIRRILGIGVLAWTVYLVPGVMKTSPWSHDALSGFPPPTFYSWYAQDDGDAADHVADHSDDEGAVKKYHPPYDDFDVAMAKAKEEGKPLLLDFTGWACVNCRKMEESVWTDSLVLKKLRNDFIVVSLYVDDRVKLDEADQGVFEYETADGTLKQKKIRTKGDKWATFQSKTFNNNSQPYYVMLSPEGELLANPVGYTPDVLEYRDYLDCGINGNQN